MKPRQADKVNYHLIAVLDSLIAAREREAIERKKLREAENPSFSLSCWYAIKDFFTVV